jgi:hypothetical protein
MAVWDLFSKREKRKANQGKEDVYQYETLPAPFRVQVVHILLDTLGRWGDASFGGYPPNEWWQEIFQTICRERGCFGLTEKIANNPLTQCCGFISEAPTVDVLDLIEVAFRFAVIHTSGVNDYYRQRYGLRQRPEDAVRELNIRFREHGIGYEFTGGQLVRMDSVYIHAEATKPAIQLLHGAGKNFAGPLDEFLAAHAKYRKGEYKETILAASHAFESTLKSVCVARGWAFDPHKDTASKLIDIVFSNGLIPTHLQNQFQGLRALLESGPHVTRNKTPGAGHGQGATPVEAPEHLARYALNLAASNIVFLIESHQELP